MLRTFLLIICSVLAGLVQAQLVPDRQTFDFGTIEHFNNDTAYFTLTNTGSKTIYLLQTQPKDDYAVLCDTKTVLPGEQMRIAIIYYTGQKGRFNLSVPLNFSHLTTPMVLTVKGNIRSITETAYSTCPSIENTSPLKPKQSPLSIIVRDAETNERLDNARVSVTKKNSTFNCVPGFAQMAYQCKCDYGKLQVSADKETYLPETVAFDYDADNNTCFIYLKKPRKDSIPEKPLAYEPEEPEQNWEQQIVDTFTHHTLKDSFIPEQPLAYIPSIISDSGFNSLRYKPNHLIFIIDISKSMKDSVKLHYLKQVMKRLVSEIRPQDYVTLITYASRVKVVFEHVSGTQSRQILLAIDTLTANGGSNGAKSIMMAYEIANRHLIKDGNNQVFLATDGLFNSSSIGENELYKIARKEFHSHKIILSAIAFGHDEKALMFLDKLTKNGEGNFLTISSLPGDISILLDEVKRQSAIQ